MSQAERSALGEIRVDLEAETDLGRAGASDDLLDTVDYVEVYELVRQAVEEEEFQLLEALATRIADRVLAIPRVTRVRLRVAKQPRLPGQRQGFAVEIVRPT